MYSPVLIHDLAQMDRSDDVMRQILQLLRRQ